MCARVRNSASKICQPPNLQEHNVALFISYRRIDTGEPVGRIYDRLTEQFPTEEIFRDLESIPIGQPYEDVIREKLRKSKVALVIIGPQWASITDACGNPRLEDPNDLVRIEVLEALSLEILVVPVLVSKAEMPSSDKLPPALQQIVRLNAVDVRPDPDFHRDMDRLIDKLSNLLTPLAPAEKHTQPTSKNRLSTAVASISILIFVAVVAVFNLFPFSSDEQPSSSDEPPSSSNEPSASVSVPAVHSHGYGACDGTLTVTKTGLSFKGPMHSIDQPFQNELAFEFIDNTDGHSPKMSNFPWLQISWLEGAHIASFRFQSRKDFSEVRSAVDAAGWLTEP